MMTGRMLERGALLALVTSTAAIGASYVAAFRSGGAPGWAAWAMAIGTATCMTSITLLAVASGIGARHRRGALAAVVASLVAVWALMALCFALALVLPAETAAEPRLWLGLPRRAAVLMYGVGLVPLLILPFAYAFTFDALTLPPAELERIRDAARRANGVDDRSAAA